MSKTDYKGIDYSLSQSNHDEMAAYGVISANSVASHIWDILEPTYQAACPNCGDDLDDDQVAILSSDSLPCPSCDEIIEDDQSIYGDEPSGWQSNDPDLELDYSSDMSVIWVLKSPVAVKSQYCSPCCPGAGNLDSPCDEGVLTYALPLELFDDYNPAPYSDTDIIDIGLCSGEYIVWDEI